MKSFTKKSIFQILEEIPAVIVLYGDKIIYANLFACKLTGYSLKEFRKKHLWEFVNQKKREEIKQRTWDRIKSEILDRVEGVLNFITKEGKHIYLKYIVKRIKIENEHFELFLGVDISKEVNQEKD